MVTLGLCAAQTAGAASDYAGTKYPLILAHGMSGFDNIGPLEYWYGIPGDLRRNGAKVYVTQESAISTSTERGEQFLTQVEDILAISGASKANLIGHSHGDQSVRYVAGVRPNLIASATSVAGATKGSPVADLISGVTKLTGTTGLLASIGNALGKLVSALAGENLPQNTAGGLMDLTSKGAKAFSQRFPGGIPRTSCGEGASEYKGVRYYSWAGVAQMTNKADPVDYLMSITSLAFLGKGNDGLVGGCYSHLGKVIRDDYPLNHFDIVNQVVGLVGPGADPVSLFRIHANRLKTAGL